MYVKQLEVKNFRNISHINIDPCEGINIIYGQNAQGRQIFLKACGFLPVAAHSVHQRMPSLLTSTAQRQIFIWTSMPMTETRVLHWK